MQRAMTNTTKAAPDNLSASGATAITIVESEGCCTFRAGLKIDPNALSIYWLREEQAAGLLKQARHDAGRAPDAATAEAALHRAGTGRRYPGHFPQQTSRFINL